MSDLNVQKVLEKTYQSQTVAKNLATRLTNQTGTKYTVANTGGEFVVLPAEEPVAEVTPLAAETTCKIAEAADKIASKSILDTPVLCNGEVVMEKASQVVIPACVDGIRTYRVSIRFLKETPTCMVGIDMNGVRRWFNKDVDAPFREGTDTLSAVLDHTRAKQKGFIA